MKKHKTNITFRNMNKYIEVLNRIVNQSQRLFASSGVALLARGSLAMKPYVLAGDCWYKRMSNTVG